MVDCTQCRADFKRPLLAAPGRLDNGPTSVLSAKFRFCELECQNAAVGDLTQSAMLRHWPMAG